MVFGVSPASTPGKPIPELITEPTAAGTERIRAPRIRRGMLGPHMERKQESSELAGAGVFGLVWYDDSLVR